MSYYTTDTSLLSMMEGGGMMIRGLVTVQPIGATAARDIVLYDETKPSAFTRMAALRCG